MTTVERLRASRSIREVLRRGHRRSGTLLSAHLLDRGDTDPTRMAVVASRKVGTAVRRNRAKRLLREAGRHVGWPSGTDAVLVARRACADSAMGEVRAELASLLEDADIAAGA